ncbi:hypothetical protein RHMOL_Rhmol07G0237200 [Rhododendron molle]|uniref:Uncharacterized protein n=1 Tax=Rhododendron molle TaxID=49168 RepID=A0ACC0N3T4_RHOML|nr:hypothetical protein RHMOL_Rhmol07G0237200 [Rhododendron molle]
MHNQCVFSNPDVQIVVQNVTNEAAAGDMLSSSSGVEKSAMGSGKVRGSLGEGILTSTETSREEYDEDEDNHIEEEPILAPVKAAINGVKGKKKRKTIDDILGFTKVNSANNKGRKNKQKCEVYRSAVAALALSASILLEDLSIEIEFC